MNHAGGYHSTYSRSQSAWSLSSEDKRYSSRGITHMRSKRQFVNRAQSEEKGTGDRREERYSSLPQEQHGCDCDQFRRGYLQFPISNST